MKNLVKIITASFLFATGISVAEQVELDRVAVIVNDGIVLESEVNEMLAKIKKQAEENNQDLPSDKALRVQIMDKLIEESLIAQMGERMGIQLSDLQLDEALENIAEENKMTLEEFRKSIEADGMAYEKYREKARAEMVSGEVRRNSVRRRVYVSPQEIANLLEVMKTQTNNDVEYRLGHILIEFPADPTQQDINETKERADKVIDLLNNGSDFTKIAIASSGGANALEGGDMGWRNINELPTLFSELVEDKDKGTVLGPIRTGLGFSIIKVNDIRGRQVVEVEEVKARHILIRPTIILSEAKAKEMLTDIRKQIIAGDVTFEDMAREHSGDGTAARGGDLGWADPKIYDKTFSKTLAGLELNELSEPFRSSFGWHITELTGRRTLDATKQMNQNRAHQILFNRKFSMESVRWIKEIRDQAYIEVME